MLALKLLDYINLGRPEADNIFSDEMQDLHWEFISEPKKEIISIDLAISYRARKSVSRAENLFQIPK